MERKKERKKERRRNAIILAIGGCQKIHQCQEPDVPVFWRSAKILSKQTLSVSRNESTVCSARRTKSKLLLQPTRKYRNKSVPMLSFTRTTSAPINNQIKSVFTADERDGLINRFEAVAIACILRQFLSERFEEIWCPCFDWVSRGPRPITPGLKLIGLSCTDNIVCHRIW